MEGRLVLFPTVCQLLHLNDEDAVMVFLCFPALNRKEKPPMNVVGDVGGKIAIIVVC